METNEIARENTTVSYDEWKKLILDQDVYQDTVIHYVHDLVTADFIREVVESYLILPVGYHNGQLVKANSVRIDRLADLIKFKKELVNSGKKILLYMVILMYSFSIYNELNTETFDVIPLGDNARMSPSYWVLRYAEV
jgi:hypothetical protein